MRLKLFLWKVVSDVVPKKIRIATQIGIEFEDQDLYCLCKYAPETISHLMMHCGFSQVIWRESPWPMGFLALALGDISLVDWITLIIHPLRLRLPVDKIHHFQLYATNAVDLLWFNR